MTVSQGKPNPLAKMNSLIEVGFINLLFTLEYLDFSRGKSTVDQCNYFFTFSNYFRSNNKKTYDFKLQIFDKFQAEFGK